MVRSLYEKLTKLRLLASVLYDQCTAAGLDEEQKEQSIKPLREQRDQIIHDAIRTDLGEVVSAITALECDARADDEKSRWHQQKATEVLAHAGHLRELLKQDLLKQGMTEKMSGNYMINLVEGKLHIR